MGFRDQDMTGPESLDWDAEYETADYHPETGENYECHEDVHCDSETSVVKYAAVEEEDGEFRED